MTKRTFKYFNHYKSWDNIIPNILGEEIKVTTLKVETKTDLIYVKSKKRVTCKLKISTLKVIKSSDVKEITVTISNKDCGIEKGEVCNRDGCTGIIDEYEKDGGCLCHTGVAPCTYCTKGYRFCPICEWEEQDA